MNLVRLRDVRIVPFRTSSRYHGHMFTLEQVHSHTSEGIDTPLRVSPVTKIIPEERSKVLGKSSFHDRISSPAHHLCLEHQVMLRQCVRSCGLDRGNVMQHRTRRSSPTGRAGTVVIDSIHTLCMPFQSKIQRTPESQGNSKSSSTCRKDTIRHINAQRYTDQKILRKANTH